MLHGHTQIHKINKYNSKKMCELLYKFLLQQSKA